MKNADLKQKYNDMHTQGRSAWFDDGHAERNTIVLQIGWPGKTVLEIGCGEGDLMSMIHNLDGDITGVDYSKTAIDTAKEKHPHLHKRFICGNYDTLGGYYDVIVMQGVLEHLDHPFKALKTIIDRFTPKAVVTSSPCFINTRGIVWMTLDMLGAVMSKTDLHYLNPWEFEGFCYEHQYGFRVQFCDRDWASDKKMLKDLKQRIPLALKDGNIQYDENRFHEFMRWLSMSRQTCSKIGDGAVAVYRIDT